MKNSDKVIQEKMRSLDTLSSGIVYGKEDAWEKLQSRMDLKPVRGIGIKYWAAAAVVLLAVIIAIPVYFNMEKEVVKSSIRETKTNPITAEDITRQTPVVIEQPGKTLVHTVLTPAKKKQAHVVIASKIADGPMANNVETPIQHTEYEAHDNIVKNIAPAPKPIEPMKVVHIDDVKSMTVVPRASSIAANKESITDIKDMQVLHITDVVKEEYEVKKIRRENRVTFGRNIFTRPSYDDNYTNSNTDDNNEPHHLLKNIFNTQN